MTIITANISTLFFINYKHLLNQEFVTLSRSIKRFSALKLSAIANKINLD